MNGEDYLKKRVTIYQVAKESGYSLATVSRVINNKENVTEETKRKIQETIAKLGYKPSAIAQGLAKSKTTNIGIVIPSNIYTYVASMLSGMVDIAKIYGYQTVLFVTSQIQEESSDVVEKLISSNVDGAVIFDDQLSNEDIEKLTSYSVPTVVIGRELDGTKIASVPLYYEDSIKEAVKNHFEKGGKEDIYFLHINRGGALMERLEKVCEEECRTLGKETQFHIIEVNDSYSLTYKQFMTMFDTLKEGYFIAPRDSIACGVTNAAVDKGISIPEHVQMISVIGTKYSAISRPSLSSFDIDMYEVGSIAMRMLTKLLSNSLKTRVFPFYSTIEKRTSTK